MITNFRRSDSEKVKVGDFFDSTTRYYDYTNELSIVKLTSGKSYISNKKNEMIYSVIGSSVVACIYDEVNKIGGMASFLLRNKVKDNSSNQRPEMILEELIDGILDQGGKKNNIQVKFFGGGDFNYFGQKISGESTIDFIRNFSKKERLKVKSTDLGGHFPRRIHFYPTTGKVLIRKLSRIEDYKIIAQESNYISQSELDL